MGGSSTLLLLLTPPPVMNVEIQQRCDLVHCLPHMSNHKKKTSPHFHTYSNGNLSSGVVNDLYRSMHTVLLLFYREVANASVCVYTFSCPSVQAKQPTFVCCQSGYGSLYTTIVLWE